MVINTGQSTLQEAVFPLRTSKRKPLPASFSSVSRFAEQGLIRLSHWSLSQHAQELQFGEGVLARKGNVPHTAVPRLEHGIRDEPSPGQPGVDVEQISHGKLRIISSTSLLLNTEVG